MKLVTLVKKFVDNIEQPFEVSPELKAKLEKKYGIPLKRINFNNFDDLDKYIEKGLIIETEYFEWLGTSKYYKKYKFEKLKKYAHLSDDELLEKIIKKEDFCIAHQYALVRTNNVYRPRLEMFDCVITPAGLLFNGDYNLGLEFMRHYQGIEFNDGLLSINGVDNSIINWTTLLYKTHQKLSDKLEFNNIIFKRTLEELL